MSGPKPQRLPNGLVTALAEGRVPWDALTDFPAQTPQERAADAAVAAAAMTALAPVLDGERVEQDRALPADFFATAHRAGLLRLQVAAEEGGAGLSDYGTFRLITALMERSTAAGFAVAVHNGIGLPALLPVLQPGELRALILDRLDHGAVSGWADTEPQGAANLLPSTVAEPRPGGGFRLTGEKVFIGNGTVAHELIVSATVPATDHTTDAATPADARLFLVDTASAGFRVRAAQEVIGLKGLSLGALELRGVEVPAVRVITGPDLHWRDARLLEPISSRGRAYLVAGAALAIGRRCVDLQRDFARRRAVNGRPLAEYPVIRRLIARSLADLYALDTTTRWGLLGEDALTARHADRNAGKNLATAAAWRIVERTMSLFAAEGAETAFSKRQRGAPALPVEQLLRDARVLRITGGIDFAVDQRNGHRLVLAAAEPPPPASGEDAAAPHDTRLSPANARHLETVAALTRRLARALTALRDDVRGPTVPPERQLPVIAAGRIAGELLSMTVTLARAAAATAEAAEAAAAVREQRLASIHCADTLNRITPLWRDLEAAGEDPSHRSAAEDWLAGSSFAGAPVSEAAP